MEIKHWFWLADSRKPVKMYGWITEDDADRLIKRQRERKAVNNNG